MSESMLVSAVERVEKALGRIQSPEFEGAKVFTAVFFDSALQEASASDARAKAGAQLGPLDGRIVAVKALFDIAGQVTSAGSRVLRRLPPANADSLVVSRLRAAGAIIIGTTQMTEFAFSALGTNPHDGTPGNPRDRRRVPGGSSSGAVVSVIDGMAELAIGSDTGGSIRIPAALSGAVGFKPTSGRVPTQGAFSLSSTLDTVGPIALNVATCAAADHVLAGGGSGELQTAEPKSFRLLIAHGRPFNDAELEVIEAFECAITRLRDSRIDVGIAKFDEALDSVAELDKIGTFPPIELMANLRQLGITDLSGVDPNTRERIEIGARLSAVDYVRLVRLRQFVVAAFEASLPHRDVIVLPTTPIQAPLISAVLEGPAFHRANGLVLRNPRIANLLDCPSISLPLPGSLPSGLMLISRRHSDRRLLEVAACVENMLGRDH